MDITVRKFKQADSVKYLYYSQNSENIEYLRLATIANIDEANKIMLNNISIYDQQNVTKHYCIALKSDDSMIGEISAIYKNEECIEVAVWIWPDYQRMGFATQAIRQLREMTKKHIIAMIDINNEASIALFQSLGFNLISEDDLWVTYELT